LDIYPRADFRGVSISDTQAISQLWLI